MVWMASLSLDFFEVGARMSSSRWIKSHQKGGDRFVGELMIVSIILACNVRKRFLLFPFKKCRQVVRKCGGSWS